MRPPLPAVILAAGSGRRMGGPKALLRLDGSTLLQRAVRAAREAGCDPAARSTAMAGGPASHPEKAQGRQTEAGRGVGRRLRHHDQAGGAEGA